MKRKKLWIFLNVIEQTVFDKIYQNINNERLKKTVLIHYSLDYWKENTADKEIEHSYGNLNQYDTYVANIVEVRHLSLNYNYKLAILKIRSLEKQLETIKLQYSETPLLAFIYHTFAITFAYLGKIDSKDCNYYFNKAVSLYEKQNYNTDLLLLKIHQIDIKYYSTDEISLIDLINECNHLFASTESHMIKNELRFRLGVFHLVKYIQRIGNDDLVKSFDFFKEFIQNQKEDNYKNYWANCGIIITSSYLGYNIEESLITNDIPNGSFSKAKGYPLILFIITRAHILIGQTKKIKRIFFSVERRIDNLLNQFPDDIEYQENILNRYALILEEWINFNVSDNNDSILERAIHIIHVNELLQNRLLLKNKTLGSPLDGSLFKAKKFIQYILEKGKGLLYTSIEIKGINAKAYQCIVLINELNANEVKIVKLEIDEVHKLENQFRITFKLNSSRAEQDRTLDIFGNMIEPFLDKMKKSKYAVVPNGFFNYLPIHMGRIENQYLYEHKKINYIPNLSIKKNDTFSEEMNLGVFYTTAEENSIKEAEILNKKYNATLYADPLLETFKEMKKHNHIHIVAHHDDLTFFFKDSQIKTKSLIDLFTPDIHFASLNICNRF